MQSLNNLEFCVDNDKTSDGFLREACIFSKFLCAKYGVVYASRHSNRWQQSPLTGIYDRIEFEEMRKEYETKFPNQVPEEIRARAREMLKTLIIQSETSTTTVTSLTDLPSSWDSTDSSMLSTLHTILTDIPSTYLTDGEDSEPKVTRVEAGKPRIPLTPFMRESTPNTMNSPVQWRTRLGNLDAEDSFSNFERFLRKKYGSPRTTATSRPNTKQLGLDSEDFYYLGESDTATSPVAFSIGSREHQSLFDESEVFFDDTKIIATSSAVETDDVTTISAYNNTTQSGSYTVPTFSDESTTITE